MNAEHARERAYAVMVVALPASWIENPKTGRMTPKAVRLRDRIAEALLKEHAELRKLLRDCAERLHAAAAFNGNGRVAVEALVGQFLGPIGAPIPAWPTDIPECGTAFEDDE